MVRVSWRDAWLPGVLLGLGVFELAMLRPEGWGYGVCLESVAALLLVLRRRRPLPFATGATLVVLLMPWVGPQLHEAAVPILYFAVSLYSLARWLPDHRGLIGLGLILGALLADYLLVDERVHDITDVMFVLSLAAPPYVLGRVSRKLSEQAALLERNQELVRREAVRDERDRIARELHDVIAHSVSAMVVQTAAAQDLVHTRPDKAAAVLAEVAATGRRALGETGRLLHVIRDEGDELGLGPAPGLAEVPALVETFRESGLPVELQIDEPLPRLTPGLDVSTYRIVQEALTNALKHGTGETASVRLETSPTALTISASNPVNGHHGDGSGLGLLGMGERVALLGGRLTHGVGRQGRFELSATLPLTPEQS